MRVAVVALIASLAVLEAEAVTPVQKVIELMTGMVEKGKKEKHDEQVQFAAYKQFCDDTTVEKTRLIAEANQKMEALQADIEKYQDTAARLTNEIAKHDDDIATWTGDLKASSTVRDIEHNDYMDTNKDYSESIQALKEGIKTIGAKNHDVGQAAASFAQLSVAPLLSAESKKEIDTFLRQGQQDLEENLAVSVRQPEAAAYSSATSGLIDMLNKLVEKFQDEQTELQKAETEARQAYELLEQDLKTYVETATKARMDKAEAKTQALEAAGDAKSDLEDTTTTRDDDTKYLSDTTATCEQKSSAFEERQALRAGEIEAVEKAIEILSGAAVSGAADKHLPALYQRASLAQLRSGTTNPSQLEVAAFLTDQARRLNSRILRAISLRVTDDPFKKVAKMIKDLIVKLMEEANGEAEQKGYCDTELATNEQTRKEKTEAVEGLHADIDELEATVSMLTEEISDLTKAVQELDAAVAKATELRNTEKEKNTVTIADAKAAQTAVASAMATLKEFYAKAGQATSLMQAPEIFDEPYKGMGGESGGVIGMIEVIQSDFARLEAETVAGEEEATKEYKDFMSDSKMDKEAKNTDIDNKSAKKQNDEQSLEEKKSDLGGAQKELTAALEYYEKLKPQCIDSGVSYEDRVARRKEEIASLQQALQILNGEDVAA
jgi:DNA repair exonuclease SbcCD ATPase subunit